MRCNGGVVRIQIPNEDAVVLDRSMVVEDFLSHVCQRCLRAVMHKGTTDALEENNMSITEHEI